MIKVSLDEAAIFDILTILLIKTKKSPDLQHTKNYLNFVADIKDEIGLEKLYSVMSSVEFENLRAANLAVFNAVSLAAKDEVKASELDILNYCRFTCKQALQQKHFDTSLSEQKIGY